MGLDENAVVDPELKVHGLDGLRISDVSVMPAVPSAPAGRDHGHGRASL